MGLEVVFSREGKEEYGGGNQKRVLWALKWDFIREDEEHNNRDEDEFQWIGSVYLVGEDEEELGGLNKWSLQRQCL